MANHCIEVICIKCGATECLRGCQGTEPDEALLLRVPAELNERDRYTYKCKWCKTKSLFPLTIINQ